MKRWSAIYAEENPWKQQFASGRCRCTNCCSNGFSSNNFCGSCSKKLFGTGENGPYVVLSEGYPNNFCTFLYFLFYSDLLSECSHRSLHLLHSGVLTSTRLTHFFLKRTGTSTITHITHRDLFCVCRSHSFERRQDSFIHLFLHY